MLLSYWRILDTELFPSTLEQLHGWVGYIWSWSSSWSWRRRPDLHDLVVVLGLFKAAFLMLEETLWVGYRVWKHVLLGARVPDMLSDGKGVLRELWLGG